MRFFASFTRRCSYFKTLDRDKSIRTDDKVSDVAHGPLSKIYV